MAKIGLIFLSAILTCIQVKATEQDTRSNSALLCNDSSTILSEHCDPENEIKSQLRYENGIYLKKSSFLYGLTVVAEDYNHLHSTNNISVNSKCLNDIKLIKKGIDNKEIWAIKLLDSSGTLKDHFVWGNNFWIGSKKSCDFLNGGLTMTISKRYHRIMLDNLMHELSPIKVKFRMLHAKHNSPWQLDMKIYPQRILHVGLCVPQSCSNNEIKKISQHTFNQNTLQFQRIYEMRPHVINVRDLELRLGFYNKITVKFLILIVAGTLILSVSAAYVSPDEPYHISTFQRIVRCFSIKQNFETVTKMDAPPSSIPVINGLRSISCIFILVIHVSVFMYFTLDNEGIFLHYLEQFKFQILTNISIMVDFFFSISGFLLAANFLKNKTQMDEIKANSLFQNIKLFGRMLLQRYIRLSPLYIMTLLIAEIGCSYLVDVSYFYIYERNDQLFEKYWWRNLLYIQNLFHLNDLCAAWTWSLACEMQYFIVFTIFLFIYVKNPEQGKKIFFTFWFIMVLATIMIALYKDLNFAFDVLCETSTVMYIGPWARIHPYYIGVMAAYFLDRNNGKIYINKNYLRLIWVGSASITFLALHFSFFRDVPALLAATFIILQRLALGIVGAWVIVASITGNGNWFTHFLEHRWFVHINKVSYAIYLLNPVIVTMISGLRESATHIDFPTMITMIVSMMVIVYLLSIPFSLLFEVPYNRLSSEFIKINRVSATIKDQVDSKNVKIH